MYTCNHCKNKFSNEPYICSSNHKKYCCTRCLPLDLDEPYSFEYFNLVDSIREIDSHIDIIGNLEDRLDLEREVTELSQSTSILIFGDDEGLFYKRQIGVLLSTLDNLYDKIHNIFIKRKFKVRPSIVINCFELKRIVSKEIFDLIIENFEDELKYLTFENIDNPDPVHAVDLDFTRIKLSLDTLATAREFRQIFKSSINHFRKLMNQKQLEALKENSYFIEVIKLYQCVVCGEWEEWSDYTFSESLNLYKCNSWQKCTDYDVYYED
jgi:hypothetical protein